jgi:dTDP-glucose 4,6-dehydratase
MDAQKRTTLVTGAAGFIGSTYANMVVKCYPNEYFVLLDALTPVANINNLTPETRASENATFVKVDIRDVEALRKIFSEHRVTHVINFAAETHVDVSILKPALFLETNVLGTHNLLLCAREYSIERFHQISTDEVYGSLKLQGEPFTEESPLHPNNPYSASKASADMLVQAYGHTYALPIVITRSSNNYGPGQDDTKVIPFFIKQLLRGEKVPLYGDGSNIRDWIFVQDNVKAIDLVFRKGHVGDVYNIGGNCEKSNIELTRALLTLCGRDESSIEFVTDRPGHDFRYAINSKKIETGLSKTVTFFTERFNS